MTGSPGHLVVTGLGSAMPDTESVRSEPSNHWFDVKAALGGRGMKYLPPAAQYMLAAARRADADAAHPFAALDHEQGAVVVGTTTGVRGLHADMDRTIREVGSDELSPLLAPFFSVNLLASRVSIDVCARGPSTTLTTPVVAGIEGLALAQRSARLGHATLHLVGAVEVPPQGSTAKQADGAVMLVLEPHETAVRRGTAPYATLRATTAFLPEESLSGERSRRLLGEVATDAAGADHVRIVGPESELLGMLQRGVKEAGVDHADVVLTSPAVSDCLTPTRAAYDAVRRPGTTSVLVVSAAGHLASVTITTLPHLREDVLS